MARLCEVDPQRIQYYWSCHILCFLYCNNPPDDARHCSLWDSKNTCIIFSYMFHSYYISKVSIGHSRRRQITYYFNANMEQLLLLPIYTIYNSIHAIHSVNAHSLTQLLLLVDYQLSDLSDPRLMLHLSANQWLNNLFAILDSVGSNFPNLE